MWSKSPTGAIWAFENSAVDGLLSIEVRRIHSVRRLYSQYYYFRGSFSRKNVEEYVFLVPTRAFSYAVSVIVRKTKKKKKKQRLVTSEACCTNATHYITYYTIPRTREKRGERQAVTPCPATEDEINSFVWRLGRATRLPETIIIRVRYRRRVRNRVSGPRTRDFPGVFVPNFFFFFCFVFQARTSPTSSRFPVVRRLIRYNAHDYAHTGYKPPPQNHYAVMTNTTSHYLPSDCLPITCARHSSSSPSK